MHVVSSDQQMMKPPVWGETAEELGLELEF
jgi:hypothetical protein